jgi:putative transcriptional regulator
MTIGLARVWCFCASTRLSGLWAGHQQTQRHHPGGLVRQGGVALAPRPTCAGPVLRGGPLQPSAALCCTRPWARPAPVGSDDTPPAVARPFAMPWSSRMSLPTATRVLEAEAAETRAQKPMKAPFGLCLHLRVGDGLEMTTSRDVLEAVSSGRRAAQGAGDAGLCLVGRGAAGVGGGENSWLTVQADPALMFDTPVEQRYDKAMALLGLQPGCWHPARGMHERACRPAELFGL